MIYHCISCVSRVKYNSYFYLINILFSENSNVIMKWKYYLKKGQDEYKYDYLKFKQYLSLTYNFFMVNISPIYGVA